MAQTYTVVPPGRFATGDIDPFTVVKGEVEEARKFVQGQIDYVRGSVLGDTSLDVMNLLTQQLAALNEFEVYIPEDLLTLQPNLDHDLNVNMDISDIDTSTFGTISHYSPANPPNAGTLPTIDAPTIPEFVPSIEGITVPGPPSPTPIPIPGDGPVNPGFSYPDAPEITFPDSPSLVGINIPGAPTIVLPEIDLTDFPTLPELNIDTLIPWTEPVYAPEIWTDVKAQILTFLGGGTGIRPDVEEAMVNRGKDREDRIIRQNVQQAIEEWANRGYTAPPGMLAKHINNLREDGTVKKLGLQREVVIKAMDEELANLRFAVQQGIVAEGLFVQLHLAAVERLFMVQRLHIEWQIQIYGIMVQAYTAKLQENLIRAQVYEVQVRAALAEIEVFKALIQAEMLKTELNKVLIQSYTAEIQAREAMVNVYVAQVGAVKVQAEVYATEVTAYRTDVEAYAAKVGADKLRFDAYESQIRGEAVKADIVEAEARAYQAQIGGIATGVQAQVAVLEGAVSAFEADIAAYDANLRHWLGLNQNELAQIQANVAGHEAHTQRFTAESGVTIASSQLEATIWEAENRVAIEAYRADIERLRVIMEKAIQEAGLMLEATKTAGELTSTISAGALAALHVGATSDGSARASASGSQTLSHGQTEAFRKACSTSQNTNINFEADTPQGYFCGDLGATDTG